jgi:hypothetical protein
MLGNVSIEANFGDDADKLFKYDIQRFFFLIDSASTPHVSKMMIFLVFDELFLGF